MKAFAIAVLAATAGTAQPQHGGYAGQAVLTDGQVKRYDALRGHSSPETEHKHRH